MRILFITIQNPKYQGDYLELSILHGLREILGNNLVDIERKDVMYGDFHKVKKEDLHGRGFSLLSHPIKDIDTRKNIEDIDFVIYGTGHAYGEMPFIEKYDKLAKHGSWILDGHDLYGNAEIMKNYKGRKVIANQYGNSFKRELIFTDENVYPTGFGIPEEAIIEIDITKKNKLFQKTAPMRSVFRKETDLGGSRNHHIFDDEIEYYDDISSSWFGLTCKKGGWDSLRHYEILAAGTLLLFRDYQKKPPYCSPQKLPCYSYSSQKELLRLMKTLVKDNKPTKKYMTMLEKQREWLLNFGTTKARARNILQILSQQM
jgi:hypothetical protein